MRSILSLGVLIAVIVVGPFLAARGYRLVGRIQEVRRERRSARRPPDAPVGALVDGLRRLSRELALLPHGTPWARQHGTQMAYDNLLVRLCVALDLEAVRVNGPGGPLSAVPIGWARDLERLRLEEAVHAHGLRIHPVGH